MQDFKQSVLFSRCEYNFTRPTKQVRKKHYRDETKKNTHEKKIIFNIYSLFFLIFVTCWLFGVVIIKCMTSLLGHTASNIILESSWLAGVFCCWG